MTKHPKPHRVPVTDAAQAEAPASEAAAPEPQQDGVDPTKLQTELEAAKDLALRAHAELDNYRKRAARELEDRTRYADMALLRDLLPVLDNVDRAIQAAEQHADAAALMDGFKMVRQQLQDVLKTHDCKPIEALHQPFNPNVHHAVLQQPSEEFPANTVLMVTQPGYQLHDRVVRPSQVIVSTAK